MSRYRVYLSARPKDKSPIFLVVVAGLALFVFWLLVYFPPLMNVGVPFGYYAQANVIIARMHNIPGVEITDYWYHEDLRLEDFFVTYRLDGGPEEQMSFGCQAAGYSLPRLINQLESLGPSRLTLGQRIGFTVRTMMVAGACLISSWLLWCLLPHVRRADGCHHCGYNLTGNTTGCCPECGTATRPI